MGLAEIGENIRLLLLNFFCIWMANKLGAALLKKRRSFRLLWGYMLLKTGIVNVLFGNILMKHYGELGWLRVSYCLLVYSFSVLTCAVFCCTYEGSLTKILLGTLISELAASFLFNLSVCAVNFMEGKSSITIYVDSFQPLDCLIPLLGGSVFWVFYRIAKPYLLRFQAYELQHVKLWGAICTAGITINSSTLFTDFKDMKHYVYVAMLFAVLGALGLLWLCARYTEKVQRENRYLQQQQRLVQAHYRMIVEQREKVKEGQSLLENCRGELVEGRLTETENETRVSRYLKSLKKRYEEIQPGIYCESWMVDSILFSFQQSLKTLDIEFSCLVENDPGMVIEEGELARFLGGLLEWEIEKNRDFQRKSRMRIERKARLHIRTVKNSLVMEYLRPEGMKDVPIRKMNPWLKKHGGYFRREVQGERQRWIFIIAGEGRK